MHQNGQADRDRLQVRQHATPSPRSAHEARLHPCRHATTWAGEGDTRRRATLTRVSGGRGVCELVARLRYYEVICRSIVWPPAFESVSLRRRDGHTDRTARWQVGEVADCGRASIGEPEQSSHPLQPVQAARRPRSELSHPHRGLAERGAHDDAGCAGPGAIRRALTLEQP